MTTNLQFKAGDRVVALENVYKVGSAGLGEDKPVPEGTLGAVVLVWPDFVTCRYDVRWDNGSAATYPMYPEEIGPVASDA